MVKRIAISLAMLWSTVAWGAIIPRGVEGQGYGFDWDTDRWPDGTYYANDVEPDVVGFNGRRGFRPTLGSLYLRCHDVSEELIGVYLKTGTASTEWTQIAGYGVGTLPPGTADNQTLRWDQASAEWFPNSELLIDDSGTGQVTIGEDAVPDDGHTELWVEQASIEGDNPSRAFTAFTDHDADNCTVTDVNQILGGSVALGVDITATGGATAWECSATGLTTNLTMTASSLTYGATADGTFQQALIASLDSTGLSGLADQPDFACGGFYFDLAAGEYDQGWGLLCSQVENNADAFRTAVGDGLWALGVDGDAYISGTVTVGGTSGDITCDNLVVYDDTTLGTGDVGDQLTIDVPGGASLAGDDWQDSEVADDITLTNITQITNRDHGSLTGLTDDDHTQYGHLSQAEVIAADWDNTANPWADNEVVDALSISSSGSVDSTALYDGGTISFDWVDAEVADTLTLNNASMVDPDVFVYDSDDNDGIDSTPIGAGTPSTGAFTTLSATGNVTAGDASATDTVTITATTTVNGPLIMASSGGPDPWDAQPIVFGDGSTVGNGSALFFDADDYSPDGYDRVIVANNWSENGVTCLALENTDETQGTSFLVEDAFIAGNSANGPFIGITSTSFSPGAINNTTGYADFTASGLSDHWFDFLTSNSGGVRVGRYNADTTGSFSDLYSIGTLSTGWPGANTYAAPSLNENPSGRLIVYGGEETGAVTDNTFDDLGGAIEIHGWGSSNPDFLWMVRADSLALYVSPEAADPPISAMVNPAWESIAFTVDYSSKEFAVNPELSTGPWDFSVDDDTLFVDSSYDRIGVNDDTPSYSLDVNGSFQATGSAVLNSNGGDSLTINAGNITMSNYDWIDAQVSDALTISGGTVDSTEIGGSTPAAGTFTDLEVTGDLSVTDLEWTDYTSSEIVILENIASEYGRGRDIIRWTAAATPDTGYFLLELPYQDGTVITQIRIKPRANDVSDVTSATLTLCRRDDSSTTGSMSTLDTWDFSASDPDATGSPTNYLAADNTQYVITWDCADTTIVADYSYCIYITPTIANAGDYIQFASIGIKTSKRTI